MICQLLFIRTFNDNQRRHRIHPKNQLQSIMFNNFVLKKKITIVSVVKIHVHKSYSIPKDVNKFVPKNYRIKYPRNVTDKSKSVRAIIFFRKYEKRISQRVRLNTILLSRSQR